MNSSNVKFAIDSTPRVSSIAHFHHWTHPGMHKVRNFTRNHLVFNEHWFSSSAGKLPYPKFRMNQFYNLVYCAMVRDEYDYLPDREVPLTFSRWECLHLLSGDESELQTLSMELDRMHTVIPLHT